MKARTIELPKPTVQAIRMARARAGLTQAAAARRVHAASYRTWQDWESGRRVMPLAAWELFLAKIGERKIADR